MSGRRGNSGEGPAGLGEVLVGLTHGGDPPPVGDEHGRPAPQQAFGLLLAVVQREQLGEVPVLLWVAAVEEERVGEDRVIGCLALGRPQ